MRRGEYQGTGEKSLRARTITSDKLNPHLMLNLGIEPGPHWWEASALTTAPSLLSKSYVRRQVGPSWSMLWLSFNFLSGCLLCVFIQEQVGKVKKSYDHQLFLKSLPLGFKQFLDHISQLKYEDKPDYKVN